MMDSVVPNERIGIVFRILGLLNPIFSLKPDLQETTATVSVRYEAASLVHMRDVTTKRQVYTVGKVGTAHPG